IRRHQPQDSFDSVGHITETTTLLARAKNGNRPSLERLTDEARQNHPVATRLPRTHRIKETSNHYRQFLFFPVREGKELIQSLGSGIRPPGLRRRRQHDIVVFAEGSFAVLAVDFGGGGEENQ